VPVTVPAPPPAPESGLLRRARADAILSPTSGVPTRVLQGAKGKVMAVGMQQDGRVTLTTSPLKVERITFSGGGGKGAAFAEYAKNRALADRPEDVVMVPLSFKAPDGDKKDFSGLLNGTTNFNMDVQDKLKLQALTDDATTAHIRKRQQPKTREFASMKEMFMSLSAADLDALCDQQVEGAAEALAYRVEVEQQVNVLRERLKKSGAREMVAGPDTRALLDGLEQRATGKEEQEFLARTLNRFPELDALLDVMRERNPHPVLSGALQMNDGLRAQAHARTLLQELIYPKMVKTDHKGSAGQMLKLVDDRLRVVRTPTKVNSIIDMAAAHFRNRPDLFGLSGHKQFAVELEQRRMNLRANL
jgi:hypothetical protein